MSPIGSVGRSVRGRRLPDAALESEADDKLVHRWLLDDVNGAVEDSVGGADGTNNGVTSLDGDWAGGSAGDADGVDDYIKTTTLGDFGFTMDSGFAIALSFSGTEGLTAGNDAVSFGVLNDQDDVILSSCASGASGFEMFIRASDRSRAAANWADSDVFEDGQPHRIVYNWVDPSDVSTWNIYADQTKQSISIQDDENASSFSNFEFPMSLFAQNNRGSIGDFSDCVMDDICFFEDPLTESEAKSYANPWEQ